MTEKKDRKKLIMQIGVISIMVIIMFFWTLNIKNVFNSQEKNNTQNQEEWEDIKKDLNDTIDRVNVGLDKINKENPAATSSPEVASSTVATSSPVASSSENLLPVAADASSTPKKTNSNCPQYVNCMPMVGSTNSCAIPVGCEEITQILY